MKNKLASFFNGKLFGLIVVIFFSTIIGLYTIQAFSINFNVPYTSGGDGMMGLMFFKNIKAEGFSGILFNKSIGAPEYSSLIDSPFLDWSYVFIAWTLTRFLSFIEAYYVFYMLTYILAGISMYILLSHVTPNKILRIVLSCSYVITPYHFYRGMGHMTLSSCFCLPLGLLLGVIIFKESFKKGFPESYGNKLWKKILLCLAVIIVGTSNVYYVLFTLIICGLAVVCKMIQNKSFRALINEALIIYGIILTTILSMLPKLIYTATHGKNEYAAIRQPMETELYGLKIIQLLLPPAYSRSKLLSGITNKYMQNGWNINENYFSAIGFIAVVGFILICIHFIYSFVVSKNRDNAGKMLCFFELCTLALLLYCTTGGFGSVFSFFIMPEFRCLNRVSIMIATLCLSSLALFFEFIKRKKIYFLALLALMCSFVFSIYAEVPVVNKNWQDEIVEDYNLKKRFFVQLEDQLDENDMVYQLPYTDFPEVPPQYQMADYSHFMGYIFTDHLRWSYGGMKGRNVVARQLYLDNGMSENFLIGIKNAGFKGIYIDGYAYEDGGAAIVSFYSALLNKDPLTSEDNRLYFFRLN